MTRQQIIDDIREFLAAETPPSPTADLYECGAIDSFKMIALVLHLEQRFGLSLGEDDLSADNFRTLEAIADFVEGRR